MFFVLLVATAIALGSTQETDLSRCPFGLVRNEHLKAFGDYCYRFEVDSKRDFSDAAEDCEFLLKGSLAIVKSKAVDDFLVQKLKDLEVNEEAWIGLSDRETENTFMWEDGTVFNETKGSYSNFARYEGPRESIFQSEWEDCVAIDPVEDGKWHDYHCESDFLFFNMKKYYICQYLKMPPATTAMPATKAMPAGTKIPAVPTTEFKCKELTNCTLDCGMNGLKRDAHGCSLCECDV